MAMQRSPIRMAARDWSCPGRSTLSGRGWSARWLGRGGIRSCVVVSIDGEGAGTVNVVDSWDPAARFGNGQGTAVVLPA